MYVEFDLKGTFALLLLVFVSYKVSVLCGFMFATLCFVCCFYVSLSLDPPYNFFSFSQNLFFVGFLKISLETVYPTSGIDGKRLQKVRKGCKRLEKVGIDGGLIGAYACMHANKPGDSEVA